VAKRSTERSSRLSPAGRLRCAESGRLNISAARYANREAGPAFNAEMRETEAALRAQLPDPLTGAQRILLRMLLGSYAALYRAQAGLRTARHSRRISELAAQSATASMTAIRALNALGLTPKNTGDDRDPAAMPPEERRAWARRYVADALANDGSATP
jgi:hypothetical protein